MNTINNFSIVHDVKCNNVINVYLRCSNYNQIDKILNTQKLKNLFNIYKAIIYNDVSILEDVYISNKSKKVKLLSDDTLVDYSDVCFVYTKVCKKDAKIQIKDEGCYCEDCYANKFINTYGPLDKILEDLSKNPLDCISTSKKIQIILENNKDKCLTSSEIYNLGVPWKIQGKTPKHTIAARCSTLFKQGFIKRNDEQQYHV